jgi:hypothetical protein
MPNRRHPSRFVVFRRSSIWKKGTGEDEPVSGGPPGIAAMTASTFHGAAELMSASSRGYRMKLCATYQQCHSCLSSVHPLPSWSSPRCGEVGFERMGYDLRWMLNESEENRTEATKHRNRERLRAVKEPCLASECLACWSMREVPVWMFEKPTRFTCQATTPLTLQGCENSENGNKHLFPFHIFSSLGSHLLIVITIPFAGLAEIFYFVCGTTQMRRSFEKSKK